MGYIDSSVITRFLIISDTHGDELKHKPTDRADVVIHCGDLTEESKLDEFRAAVRLLKDINAPLKLIIAGNHDFTMDTPIFKSKIDEFKRLLSDNDDTLIEKEYGTFGEAKSLFYSDEAKAAGIVFLDEGTHRFELANGGTLTIYASPYTPSINEWGFQYDPQQGHNWTIDSSVDVAITHGPPKGVLDYTHDTRQRAGCEDLFAAVARAKPRMHCFGHIHHGWGAKKVTWRSEVSEKPSHFTDIDNDKSVIVENLSGIYPHKFDTPEILSQKESKRRKYVENGYCAAGSSIQPGGGEKEGDKDKSWGSEPEVEEESREQTLFVNAAIQGTEEEEQHLPWMVDIELPKQQDIASKKRKVNGDDKEGSNKRLRQRE